MVVQARYLLLYQLYLWPLNSTSIITQTNASYIQTNHPVFEVLLWRVWSGWRLLYCFFSLTKQYTVTVKAPLSSWLLVASSLLCSETPPWPFWNLITELRDWKSRLAWNNVRTSVLEVLAPRYAGNVGNDEQVVWQEEQASQKACLKKLKCWGAWEG